MKKNFKQFSVSGKIDDLLQLEIIMIMLGYNVPFDDWWNNSKFINGKPTRLVCYKDGILSYYESPNTLHEKEFKATEIDKIIKYCTE